MNWDAIGAAGEWAGAIAVVITLIYLARQIHQQNNIAKFNASQSVWDGFREITSAMGTNSAVNELQARGDIDPDSLTDAEARQWQFFFRSYFTVTHKAFRAYELGFLAKQEWNDIASEFALNLRTPGGAAYRESHKDEGFKGFWKAIDTLNLANNQIPNYNLGRSDQAEVKNGDVET